MWLVTGCMDPAITTSHQAKKKSCIREERSKSESLNHSDNCDNSYIKKNAYNVFFFFFLGIDTRQLSARSFSLHV